MCYFNRTYPSPSLLPFPLSPSLSLSLPPLSFPSPSLLPFPLRMERPFARVPWLSFPPKNSACRRLGTLRFDLIYASRHILVALLSSGAASLLSKNHQSVGCLQRYRRCLSEVQQIWVAGCVCLAHCGFLLALEPSCWKSQML